MPYYLYILKCDDNTLYTGITTDLERRVKEHNRQLPGGAKYTRSRTPVTIVYQATYENRSEASKEEYRIKKLSKTEKEILIDKSP